MLIRGPLTGAVLFICACLICYRLLLRPRTLQMGVKDILLKLQNSDSRKADAKVPPAVPWHSRPPTSTPSAGNASVEQSAQKLPPADRPFVVVRDGQLQLDNGVPFRFASMNAPELLECHEFEVEDTMRTLTGFGRRVTRTYTLRIKGTSRYVGDAVHIEGWDAQKQDWIYSESQFRKVGKVRSDLASVLTASADGSRPRCGC